MLCAVLIASAGVVASCGTTVRANPKGDMSKNVSSIDTRDNAIRSGWRAALMAFDSAALTMNWKSPAVAATHVEPQLGVAIRNLWLEHWAHYIAIGRETVLWTEVVNVSGNNATVDACVDADEIAVYSSTHAPVPGPLGERERAEAIANMIETSSGWKLEHQEWTSPCRSR